MDARISELHAAYCKATGFDLPLCRNVMDLGRARVWADFEKAGFTREDLLLVIAWIRKQFARNNGYSMASLRFSTLLQLDTFEEKLHLARHESRLRRPKPATIEREERVGDVRRIVEVRTATEPVHISAEAENFKRQLAAWRERKKNAFPLPTSAGGKTREASVEALDT